MSKIQAYFCGAVRSISVRMAFSLLLQDQHRLFMPRFGLRLLAFSALIARIYLLDAPGDETALRQSHQKRSACLDIGRYQPFSPEGQRRLLDSETGRFILAHTHLR